ncbi:hypothetical protein N7519_008432 [Penicillium mononematosum]|uniref:uncharacterized protein n=1 Tax=Penicillium mononematosum TaxID=268346 RepID=UPI0025481E1C|nr:uncharacterized protein N7519_008432 [Penicillium mononematosum]KAJ6177971.1 hypothetical protein N7519_008432 [Penicillium mononematosum]
MEGHSEQSHTVSDSQAHIQSSRQQSSSTGETYHHDASSGPTTEQVHQTTEAPIDATLTDSSTVSSSVSDEDGRWGEQKAGKAVSRSGAMEDMEEMRRELTRLSLSRTRSATKSLRRRKSQASRRDEEKGQDEEETEDEAADSFDLGEFLTGGHLERRTTAGEPAKKVGVVFKNLTVQGVETGASFVRTLPQAVVGTFGPDLYNIQEDTRRFQSTVAQSKSKSVSKKSPYTVSFVRQVMACVQREFWLLWGDKTSLYTKYFIVISNALIVSSLFYGESLDTSGAFSRGGALFFSILFLGWMQLTELMPAVTGRGIVARHKDYAFYRPSAVSIARVIVDFPAILAMVIPFTIVVYFMSGLDVTASKFFIYFLFVYTTTFCITSLYRMFAALSPTIDDAVRFSGIALNLLILFVGYVIPKQTLIKDSIWFGWLFYVNPIAYSYEAVLTNEFSDRVMECNPSQLIPQGPGVDPRYQGCALTGSTLGESSITGSQYLTANFQFTRSHLWRNFGVVIAFTVLYLLVTVIAAEVLSFVGGGGGALVFKKSKRTKKVATPASNDEEK